MTQLTAQECEKAIDAIVVRRNELIRSWPMGSYSITLAGNLDKFESDLRILRRLQSEIASDETGLKALIPALGSRHFPDWLEEHRKING